MVPRVGLVILGSFVLGLGLCGICVLMIMKE